MYLDSLHEVTQLSKELNAIDQQIRYYDSHAYSGHMWITFSDGAPRIAIPITDANSKMMEVLKEAESVVKTKLQILGVKTTRYPDVL